MDIAVQHFDGCPNVGLVLDRLAEAGIDRGTVRLLEVASPEDADRVGFHGSPTILLDGVDPFAELGAPVGFACRVYRTAAGLEGSPSVEQMRARLGPLLGA